MARREKPIGIALNAQSPRTIRSLFSSSVFCMEAEGNSDCGRSDPRFIADDSTTDNAVRSVDSRC
jgi:hypothetical protein